MCIPRPLPTVLRAFLLLWLLWKAAWAPGTSSPKMFRCQIFNPQILATVWLIVLHIPVTIIPSPAQMLYIRAEIRAVGVSPPPHTIWLALLRLFSVLTYLLLNSWQSCEFKKGEETRLPQQLKEKKIKKFPFHMLSQNTENILKKHPNLLRKKNQEIGAVRDVESSLVCKQCGQLGWCSLCSRDRRRHTLDQKTTLPTVLAGFQFHCVAKSRYFPL